MKYIVTYMIIPKQGRRTSATTTIEAPDRKVFDAEFAAIVEKCKQQGCYASLMSIRMPQEQKEKELQIPPEH